VPCAAQEVTGNNVTGVLCIKKPWPGIARTVYGDHARYLATYMQFKDGYYFTGDGALRDMDGYYWVTGRVDGAMCNTAVRIVCERVHGHARAAPCSRLRGQPKVLACGRVSSEGYALYVYVCALPVQTLSMSAGTDWAARRLRARWWATTTWPRQL
jgi:non-ribosomal peptide synthetase component E (peptide arylation enzyme)